MINVKNIYQRIERKWAYTSQLRYISYLRKKGMKIGENISINTGELKSIEIDMTRPSLIEIGNNVRLNKNFTILTHDFACFVFLNKYKEFVPSSGGVKIGNNVYFGRNCIVFKDVTVGDNCIIGYGSVVTKDIPSDCVAIGAPAKVICTLEDYYEKRKKLCIEEAFVYARSIKERFNRMPVIGDFWEEFPLFMDGSEQCSKLPIKQQLAGAYEDFKKNHRRIFDGFEDFLSNAGLYNSVKKKLVIMHTAYWEQAMGGAELQLSYLADFAKSNGYEVHYIYEDKGKPIKNSNGLIMHPIKRLPIRRTFGLYFSFYKNTLINKLKEINPDVIFTRGAYSWSGIASQYAKSFGKKHLWAIAHDNDPLTKFKNIDIIKPLDLLEKYWIRYAIQNASVIICQNTKQQNLLRDLHKRSSILISQLGFKEDNEIKKDFTKLKILWVANLKPTKRPEIFIRLTSFFHNRNVEFIMIGKTSVMYNGILKNAINLKYFGELPNSEINRFLCESHLLINTSESEGFSNTFIQAWMRKVPVISMKSNPDEIITRHDIGRICESEEELKKTVDELLLHIDLLKSMGERAYNYAMKNHLSSNLLPKIMELF